MVFLKQLGSGLLLVTGKSALRMWHVHTIVVVGCHHAICTEISLDFYSLSLSKELKRGVVFLPGFKRRCIAMFSCYSYWGEIQLLNRTSRVVCNSLSCLCPQAPWPSTVCLCAELTRNLSSRHLRKLTSLGSSFPSTSVTSTSKRRGCVNPSTKRAKSSTQRKRCVSF